MRVIPDQLRSKNLVPFKKRHGRYKIPGMTSENEVLMECVDADLSAEEQSYVRHYLNYADALMNKAEQNVLPEEGEDDLPERVLVAEEPLNNPPPIDQRVASLADEPSSATNHRPARAA